MTGEAQRPQLVTSKVGMVNGFRAGTDTTSSYLLVGTGSQDLGNIIEAERASECVRLSNSVTALISLVLK